MGVTYLITSANNDLYIGGQSFIEQLQKEWSVTKVHHISDERAHSVLQWGLEMEDGSSFLGDFNPQGISFKGGDLFNVARIALWYRTIVPSEYKLLLYESSLDHQPIELIEGMTLEAIVQGFEVPFDISKYE